MEKFESLHVNELNAEELTNVNGGLLPLLIVFAIDVTVLGFMGGYIYEDMITDH